MTITKRFISFFIAFVIALTSSGLWGMTVYAEEYTYTSSWVLSDKTVNSDDTANYTAGMQVGYSTAVTFTNDGVVNVTGGTFYVDASSTFENNGTFNFTGSGNTFSLGSTSTSFINNGTATIKGVRNFSVQDGTSFINNGTLFMEDISYLNVSGFINDGIIIIPDDAKNTNLHFALESKNTENGQVYTKSDFENQKVRYGIEYEGLNADNYWDFVNPNPPDYEWAAADPQDITLAEPTLNGYEFLGWTGLDITEPTKNFTFSSSVRQKVTVIAHWKPIVYKITYDLDGGSFYSWQTPPTEYKRGDTKGIPRPGKNGYTFNGWIDTETGKQVSTENDTYYYMPPSALGDKTYKASFIANSDTKYTVICYYQNIDGTYEEKRYQFTGETGSQVSISKEDYDKVGFTFDSDNSDNLLSGEIKADNSLELKLYFSRNRHTVTFKSQDGSEILWTTKKFYDERVGEYGGEIPAKDSDDDLYEYVFDNWAREEPNRDFGYPVSNVVVTEDITFYAAFKKVRNESIVVIKWEQYDGFYAPAQTEIRLDKGADYTAELRLENEKYYVGTREWTLGFQEAHIYWYDAEIGDHGIEYNIDKESFDAPVVLTIPNVQHDIFIKIKAKYHEEHEYSLAYDEIIENGGCVNDSIIRHFCYKCGKKEDETVSAEGHAAGVGFGADKVSHWKTCIICNEKIEIEAHTPDEGVITREPTHNSTGTKTYTCTVCGCVTSRETLEMIPHTSEGEWQSSTMTHYKICSCGKIMEEASHTPDNGTVTLEPTYDDEGKIEYRCAVCGYLIGEKTIAPLGHKIDDEWQSDVSGHWQDCECGEKHNFGEHISDGGLVTIQPTYDSWGEQVFSCKLCGYVLRTETILPLSHKTDGEWVSDKNNHWKEGCGCGEKHELSKHISDSGTVTLYPTHTEEGKMEYRCTVCGYLISEVRIAPLGHNVDDEWQSDESGHWQNCECGEKHNFGEHNYVLIPDDMGLRHYMKCSICGIANPDSYEKHLPEGDFITDNPSYDYQKYHYQKCKCGMVIGTLHEWNDGVEEDDVKTYTCTVCGETKTEPVIHDYVLTPDDTGLQHYLKCSICGKTDPDSYEDHLCEGDFITGEPGYNYQDYHYQKCKCGMIIGMLHEWNDGVKEDDVKAYTCTVCGETKTEPVIHDYVLTPDDTGLQHYLKCSICGKADPDSYEDHLCEGDFITDEPGYNYQDYHYQKCKCGMVVGIFHTSDNGTVTLEPTYDSEGKIEYRCTVCGYLIDEEALAPFEHKIGDEWQGDESGHWQDCKCGEKHNFGEHISHGGVITTEPTYDSSGERVFSCTVCGYVLQTETIPPLSHKPDDDWVFDENNHWKEGCGCGEKHELATHTPDNGTITLEPTYDDEGIIEYHCTVCGYSIGEKTISPLGHNVDDEWQSNSSEHWQNCECGEKHNFGEHISDGGVITTEPTYNSSGERVFSCTVCGYILQTETIPPLSHKPNDNWVFDENNHWKEGCGCGEKHELATHTPDNGTVTLEPTYDDEGKIEYRCTVCGYLISAETIASLDHNIDDQWHSDASGHWQDCECGEKHNFGEHISDGGVITTEPTYDSSGERVFSCTVCGYILQTEAISPLSHKPNDNWVFDENNHWKEGCSCGEKHELATHTPDNGTVTLEPTYNSEGKVEYHCTVCGYLIGEETTAPLGHNIDDEWQSDELGHWQDCECGEKHNFGEHIFDEGLVTIEPTYDSSGERMFSCKVCGYVIGTELIPALGGSSDTPSNSSEPNEPSKPSEPNEPSKPNDDNPETGESRQPWKIAFIGSLITIMGTFSLKRKKSKTE